MAYGRLGFGGAKDMVFTVSLYHIRTEISSAITRTSKAYLVAYTRRQRHTVASDMKSQYCTL